MRGFMEIADPSRMGFMYDTDTRTRRACDIEDGASAA